MAKVNATGTALVYAGYIGGAATMTGYGIAVDGAGNAYVTGYTSSDQATFPVTGGPDLTFNGGYDAFVAKVNAAGSVLVYAGYIGGADGDGGCGIAVDGAGNAYVTGYTGSGQATFPVLGGPDLTFNGGDYDAFVAKVNGTGTALVYAGYIGGASDDIGHGIAVDGAGNAYVAGYTDSDQATFPVTGGPDLTYNGAYDAFVAKVGEQSAIRAKRAGIRPLVDGDVSEWSGLDATFLNKDTAHTIVGDVPSYADLSTALRIAWTPDTLYVEATIADDVLIGNNGLPVYWDDVLELGFGTLTSPPTVHNISLCVDGRVTKDGNPISGVTFVTRTMSGGWQLEAAIPTGPAGPGHPRRRPAIALQLRALGQRPVQQLLRPDPHVLAERHGQLVQVRLGRPAPERGGLRLPGRHLPAADHAKVVTMDEKVPGT